MYFICRFVLINMVFYSFEMDLSYLIHSTFKIKYNFGIFENNKK